MAASHAILEVTLVGNSKTVLPRCVGHTGLVLACATLLLLLFLKSPALFQGKELQCKLHASKSCIDSTFEHFSKAIKAQ